MRKLLPLLLIFCLTLSACVKIENGPKSTGNSRDAQVGAKDQPANAAKENIPSEQITLYPAYLQVPIGQHVTLDAQPEGKKFTWSSSNPSVAAVDENGRVTPVAEGEAVITCAVADDAGVTAACGVLVVADGNIYLWDGDQ